MVELFDYQQEVLDSDSPLVIMNWARGLGKTFTIANYILEKKPNRVVVFGNFEALSENIRDLIEKEEQYHGLVKSYSISSWRLELKYYNGCQVKIEKVYGERAEHRRILPTSPQIKNADLIVFEDMFPTRDPLSSKQKILCTVTKNNYHQKIQRDYNQSHLIEADFRIGLKHHLYNWELVNHEREEDLKIFYEQLAILDNPNGGKGHSSLTEFKNEAEKSLQKQFLDTPATKDTVLTRMNIIQMLKELQSM